MASVVTDGPDAMRGWLSGPWPDGPLDKEFEARGLAVRPVIAERIRQGRQSKIGVLCHGWAKAPEA